MYKAFIFDLDGTLLNTLEDLTDAANTTPWLAGDEASFITGQTLGVDGGFL